MDGENNTQGDDRKMRHNVWPWKKWNDGARYMDMKMVGARFRSETLSKRQSYFDLLYYLTFNPTMN